MKLSIGKAWDEAKAIAGRDGNVLLAIALALLVLPGTIIETVAPSSLRGEETPLWVSLLGLVALLVNLAGQLAISRIALERVGTVGDALAIAFRRLAALFGALMLVVLPFALILGVILLGAGGDMDPQKLPPGPALAILAVMLVFVFVLVRLLFLTPLAADQPGGPVALLGGAWRLSRGRSGRLLLVILLLMLVALLLVAGLGGALSAAVILLLGPVEPFNLSALLVALIQQVLAAIVSVFLALTVARLYVQARGGGAMASVPDAGHQ